MRLVASALIILASTSAALAGAWPREKGTGFAATSVQTTEEGGSSTSIYAEWGLTEVWTLGLDVTYDSALVDYATGTAALPASLQDTPNASGIVFLRRALGAPDRTNKWAVHLGLGLRYRELETLPAAELGLAWGRGFQWRDRWGWMGVETSYNVAQSPAETRIKLDGTVGYGLTERTKVMLQLFNTHIAGETFTKVAPSVIYQPRKGGASYLLGSEIPTERGEPSIKLGVWFSF